MLTFTDRAREMVLGFMEGSGDTTQALRVKLRNGSPLAPAFELTLVPALEQSPEDVVLDQGDFSVLVARESAPRLEGATVDFIERLNESGFEIRPAPGKSLDPPAVRPTGPIADKVQAVLDEQVNPGVASHGGAILLVDVKDTEVFMEMTGGCQGCAMSRMTLRQGVERMIRQAVPEVTAIHDVTDHSSGENPFYTQS